MLSIHFCKYTRLAQSLVPCLNDLGWINSSAGIRYLINESTKQPQMYNITCDKRGGKDLVKATNLAKFMFSDSP